MASADRILQRISTQEALEYEQQEGLPEGKDLFGLLSNEEDWVPYYNYLYAKGYQLRPRYRPGWVRSWKGQKVFPNDCEDSWPTTSFVTIDAVRLSDNKQVIIKTVLPSQEGSDDGGRKEVDIVQFLSSGDRRSDPRNHCVPYLDAFPVPDVDGGLFLVSPLYVPWNYPEHESVGQLVEFIRQILEGLEFMHENNVAHRDCTPPNIMMDWSPLIDEAFHPIEKHLSFDGNRFLDVRPRANHKLVYYFIDFGLSVRFDSEKERKMITGTNGRERAVPELHDEKPYDPFKVDVFILGAFIERSIIKRYHGFGFLKPLVAKMTRRNPAKRPTATQLSLMYHGLRMQIPSRNLQWSLVFRGSGLFPAFLFTIRGIVSQILFTIQKALRLLRVAS